MSRYRMPAEWEPHAATWLAWPAEPGDWSDCLAEAEAEFLELAGALAASEPTRVLVAPGAPLRERLARLDGVELVELSTREAWLRDTGPTFVHDAAGDLLALDWTFDAWSGRYPASRGDDAVAAALARAAGVAALRPGIVCEGGALEVDGAGTLLATAALARRRNPALGRAGLERELGALLGVTRAVWLDAVLPGDDTDGHVDTLARFVAPGRVACAHPELCERLAGTFDVTPLPPPPQVAGPDGPLPASYANFYIANRAVLVPQFGRSGDAGAREVLGALLPGRAIVGVPSRALLRGLGSLHCLTQQQPAAR